MAEIEARGYSSPEYLVSTDWVEQHCNDAGVRIVESNEDALLYKSGHIPGAVEIDWVRDLNDPLRRDYLQTEQFSELMSKVGITPDMTVVFYGDKGNWWACYALWVFTLFAHKNVKIMDGGRRKWEQEGREVTKAVPEVSPSNYPAVQRDDSTQRVFRDGVLEHITEHKALIDVRSPDEFSGKRLHMDGYPNEGALRGGHIPGAKSVPWARAVNESDGTFKTADELRSIYEGEAGLEGSKDTVVYCRIGERSSHTWFALSHLLGYENVRNYDGSWTEWGNLVNVPIEK